MRRSAIAAVLTFLSLSNPASAQTAAASLQAFFSQLEASMRPNADGVPFSPDPGDCIDAGRQACAFAVFQGMVEGHAAFFLGEVDTVSYELSRITDGPGALFATMAITLGTLAPAAPSETRSAIMIDMIRQIEAGSNLYSAEVGDVRISFEIIPPRGIGRLEVLR